MSTRQLATQVCGFCRLLAAHGGQQRLASTIAARRPTSAARQAKTAVASTSTAGPDPNELLASLQFEVGLVRPSAQTIWKYIMLLHEVSPPTLRKSRLIENAIPALSRHAPVPVKTQKFDRIVAVQEEGEALYGRYRFVTNRLNELDAAEGVSTKRIDGILRWLKSMRSLGYGPGASKIWNDLLELAEDQCTPSDLQAAGHSVLIATMRWLTLQRERGVNSGKFKAQAAECVAHARSVIAKLGDSWISASLLARILKEAEMASALDKHLVDEYKLNKDFPSLLTFEGGRHSAAPERMDPHTVNTVLLQYAEKGDLSKMISLFEAATCPLGRLRDNWRPTDPVNFFTSSMVASPRNDVFDSAAVQHEKGSSHETVPPSFMKEGVRLVSVNTKTYELLVRRALQSDRPRVAHHYLKHMLEAWKSERQRLQYAYGSVLRADRGNINAGHLTGSTTEHAFDKDAVRTQTSSKTIPSSPPNANSIAEQQSRYAPRVMFSLEALLPFFKMLKHSKNQRARYTPLLVSLRDMTREVMDCLNQDVLFWAQVHDALPPNLGQPTPFVRSFAKPLDVKAHLLLSTRLRIELRALAAHVEHVVSEAEVSRFLSSLLSTLKSATRELQPSETVYETVLKLQRVQQAIVRAERWLTDGAAHKERIEYTRRLTDSLGEQSRKKLKWIRAKAEKQKQTVIAAVAEAKERQQVTIAALREREAASEIDSVRSGQDESAVSRGREARQSADDAQQSSSTQDRMLLLGSYDTRLVMM